MSVINPENPAFLEILARHQANTFAAADVLKTDKIFPVEAPEGVQPPFAIYTQISAIAELQHHGTTDCTIFRIQYDFFAKTFREVVRLARTLRAAYEGRTLTLTPDTRIALTTVQSEFDAFESSEKIYRRTLDLRFLVHHPKLPPPDQQNQTSE